MTFRSRRLLDVTHEAPCMLNIAIPCGNDPSVAVHSDLLRHGRGVGHKSGDQFAISACPNCHARFTRAFLGKGQYEIVWQEAYERYVTWVWENGKVKVA